ncbi:MAG: ATP-binding protein [Candidatus Sabulitectum sp.]|nr:ATP-binding protein [Candidatus Sabulitectum sp.]
MKRFAEKNLFRWLGASSRKPLVIHGARQVGKSTLVRQFAEKNGLNLHEVNLERHPTLVSVFKTNDPGRIIQELEYLCGKGSIRTGKDLIFLDEIQAIPEAIQSLRYFFEEHPHIPLIAAGSLLEFTLAKHSISMPVGRIQYLFLYPMSFEEVLEAMSQDDLLALLRTHQIGDDFPGTAHARLLDLQRKYFLTGGMPEAVQRYIESGEDFSQVTDVHASITETYKDDFAKYSRRSALQMIHRIFEYVPRGIGEKFKYFRVSPDSHARDVRTALELLVKAQLIVKTYHTDGSGLPLGATINERIFKPYFLDCGLVNHMCGVTRISLEELQTVSFINRGKITEQFIAQHLCSMGRTSGFKSLTYWLREGRTANAEVDFLIQLDQSIVPVEVKAGKSGSLKSLLQFVSQKKCTRAVRFDLNPPSLQHISHGLAQAGATVQVECDLLSLPLYLIEQLPRLFQQIK